MLLEDERLRIQSQVSVSSFRTTGNGGTLQNIFSLNNGADSVVVVRIIELTLEFEATAALTAVSPVVRVSRPDVAPSSGSTLTKVLAHTLFASDANVVARGETTSDGGTRTGINANPAATGLIAKFLPRLHTAAGWLGKESISLLPGGMPLYLRVGQFLLVRIEAAAAASNPTTNHYVVNCTWEEVTLL